MEWLVGLVLAIVAIAILVEIVKWIISNLPWIVLVTGVPSLAGFLVSKWTGGKLSNGSFIGFGINYGVITGFLLFLVILFILVLIYGARYKPQEPQPQPIRSPIPFILWKLLGK